MYYETSGHVRPQGIPSCPDTEPACQVAHVGSTTTPIHVITVVPPTRAPPSAARHVFVVSHAELIVSDSEHACYPSVFYTTYICHSICFNE